MAELLIKAVDHVHPDPYQDRIGAYKRGDVVVINEDGHEWGAKERPPKFYVLHIPGVAAADLADLVAPQTVDDNGLEQGIPRPDGIEPVIFRRRNFRVDLSSLPPGQLKQLQKEGKVSHTLSWLEQSAKRIRDNKPLKEGKK